MQTRMWLVGLALAVSCVDADQKPDTATPAPREVVVESQEEAPAAPPPARAEEAREIYIDRVDAGNPLIVKGRARTFENSVSLRLRDARGALLMERYVTSVGEMGQHNPFEAQLWVVRDPGDHVTVEAFEYSAKDGSVRSLTKKTSDYRVERTQVTLMFPAGDCDRLAAFKREVPKSKALARLLVEALLAGPTASEKAAGATPAFPDRSEVRSVILREGVLTVDFNERLQNVGGACASRAIRTAVTQTLQQLPTVKRIVITAGGSEALALQP